MNRKRNELLYPQHTRRVTIRIGGLLCLGAIAGAIIAVLHGCATATECKEYVGRAMQKPGPLPNGQAYRFDGAMFHPDDCTYEVTFDVVPVGEKVQE